MARLLMVLVMIIGGGYLINRLLSDTRDSGDSSAANSLNALFQQQVNAVGQREQRKKFATIEKIPLDGNEVSLARLIANPQDFLDKTFILFGKITPSREKQTRGKKKPDRLTFRFQELTAKRQPVPQAVANLQIDSQQSGDLPNHLQKHSRRLVYGRFRVTLISLPDKVATLQLNLIDWQFARDNHSGFEAWNTEKISTSP